jgi:tetratricopeptide (TPR) repeat protein
VELRRSRQAAGLSLRQLAARVGYDHSYLSQVERGQRPGSAHLAQLCDRALGTGPLLAVAYERVRPRRQAATLGAVTGRTATDHTASGQFTPGHLAHSRTTTSRTAAGPAAAGQCPAPSDTHLPAPAPASSPSPPLPGQAVPPGPDRLEATRHGLATSIGLVPDVAEWSALAAAHASDYLTAPPAELLRDLGADLELLRAAAGTTAGSAAVLSVPAAHLSVLMALTLGSLGRNRAATRWWRTARDTADRSGNPATRSLVRSFQGMSGYPDSGTLAEQLELSEQALVIDSRPVAAARALAAKGHALAELARSREARAVLEDFRAAVTEVPVDVRSDSSVFGWAAYKVHWVESWIYTALGDTAAAYDAQDRALVLSPPEHRREQAQLHLHRAHCLVLDKKVAAGLATAMRVLVELPDQWHTEFLYDAAGRCCPPYRRRTSGGRRSGTTVHYWSAGRTSVRESPRTAA